ncbi:MAG: isopentenyl-diphosphate Delta-isomerase [Gammaproteobacteria bacterium]|nr:isopentenyl-diphosphate Delta-isomerase [Gammaproteobacteria bacterium]
MIVPNAATVSSPKEQLILVDELDNPIGHCGKRDCHTGEGMLHRAFSLFVFNSGGELLLQRRSTEKPLWPSYWSNTCCSHPRRGETMDQAVHRRLAEELGIAAKLSFLYKFQYRARYRDVGTEHEVCWVYTGTSDDQVQANGHEIAEWGFVDPLQLGRELADNPDSYTPWLKLEWAELQSRGFGGGSWPEAGCP